MVPVLSVTQTMIMSVFHLPYTRPQTIIPFCQRMYLCIKR